MTDVVETSFELPTIEQVAGILAMCDEHDIPPSQLPGLWDKYTALQQVERRLGIQNGNMERELIRLRQLTSELDKQISAASGEVELYRMRIKDLEETEDTLRARVRELEALGLDSAAYLRRITELEDQIGTFTDKYEALLLRCKHFEGLADQRKLADLEDIIEHYRCGMNGMKELAANKHFSHEWRLWLITRTLNVFEPAVKEKAHA
ncbi:hypothetical protein ZL58_14090 [Salmonella enterica subsp. enterica serovar Typhimurium]|nr:hypothetical protein [Salmonella enterica subsp. enterica serovar Typhimurium]